MSRPTYAPVNLPSSDASLRRDATRRFVDNALAFFVTRGSSVLSAVSADIDCLCTPSDVHSGSNVFDVYELGYVNAHTVCLAALFAVPGLCNELDWSSPVGMVADRMMREDLPETSRFNTSQTLADCTYDLLCRDDELSKHVALALCRHVFVNCALIKSREGPEGADVVRDIVKDIPDVDVNPVTTIEQYLLSVDADAVEAFVDEHAEAVNAPRLVFYTKHASERDLRENIAWMIAHDDLDCLEVDNDTAAIDVLMQWLNFNVSATKFPPMTVTFLGALAEMVRLYCFDTVANNESLFYDLDPTFLNGDFLGVIDLLFRRLGVGIRVHGKADEVTGDEKNIQAGVSIRFEDGRIFVHRRVMDIARFPHMDFDRVQLASAMTSYDRYGAQLNTQLLLLSREYWDEIRQRRCRPKDTARKFVSLILLHNRLNVNYKRALSALGKDIVR